MEKICVHENLSIAEKLSEFEYRKIRRLNRIARNGLIYFPDFCKLVLDTFREEKNKEEQFRRNMFKGSISLKTQISEGTDK